MIVLAQAKQRHDWQLQSSLMAHIAAQLGAKDARPTNYMPESLVEPEDYKAEISDTISMTDAIRMFRGHT